MSRQVIDVDDDQPLQVLTLPDLVAGLRALGLRAGGSVLVHSSLSSLGRVDGGAEAVIAALLEVLGPAGNLMAPYFFPLYEGVYDPAHPPVPYTGLIPRRLRAWPGAVLSLHPSHPFVAVGPAASQLTAGHERAPAVGRGSPIDRLAALGGSVLLLGVDQRVNTLIHTAEAYAGVPYMRQPRPDRPSRRLVRLPGGEALWVALGEYPGDSAGFQKAEPLLEARGLIARGTLGRARCRLMPAMPVIEAVAEVLRRDPAAVLCDRADCSVCAWARGVIAASRPATGGLELSGFN